MGELPSMLTSELSGLGAFAISNNLADKRSARAFSAGPKMVAAVRWWLFFLELDLELLAMVSLLRIREWWLIVGPNKRCKAKKNATRNFGGADGQ